MADTRLWALFLALALAAPVCVPAGEENRPSRAAHYKDRLADMFRHSPNAADVRVWLDRWGFECAPEVGSARDARLGCELRGASERLHVEFEILDDELIGVGDTTLEAFERPASAAPAPTAFGLGEAVALAYGQSASTADGTLTVTFTALDDDQRCPSSVNCFWEGSATVHVRFESAQRREDLQLATTEQSSMGLTRTAEPAGYVVRLIGLKPYPLFSDLNVDARDYTATLCIVTAENAARADCRPPAPPMRRDDCEERPVLRPALDASSARSAPVRRAR